MAYYIRYYDNEILVNEAAEIEPFLQSINRLSPREMGIVHKKLDTLRQGTNRIYLDAAKKKYLLVIGTNQTNIEEFHKNAKPQQPAEDPYDSWHHYYLDYYVVEDGMQVPYSFKAKLRHCDVLQLAYVMMANHLKEKYKDQELVIPEFSPENIRVE